MGYENAVGAAVTGIVGIKLIDTTGKMLNQKPRRKRRRKNYGM